jgi:hypothetical protein
MTPPADRRRSQFIDAVIDDYSAAHSTPPEADQLELQRITQEKTGRAAGMQMGAAPLKGRLASSFAG